MKKRVVIDTDSGVDDALALLLALLSPELQVEAISFANAAGALTVTKKGAQDSLPTREENAYLQMKSQG